MSLTPSKELTEDLEEVVVKHNHYFKPVTYLSEIDVYRVCDLYKINDSSGCIQHAIKKLLVPGGRGVKGTKQDIQEAIDTLNRKIAMMEEDSGLL